MAKYEKGKIVKGTVSGIETPEFDTLWLKMFVQVL